MAVAADCQANAKKVICGTVGPSSDKPPKINLMAYKVD
jgi:hypothetical protein